MSLKKKPKEGFVDAGWAKNFKLPVLPESSEGFPDLAEVVVGELQEKLGGNYPIFKGRLEGIAGRYISLKELDDERPDTGEIRAMLDEWYRRAQSLYELIPDSISEERVSDTLRRHGVDYKQLKKRMKEDHSTLLNSITLAERELGPSPTGRRPKRLNRAVAEETAVLLEEFGLPATDYEDGICAKLLRIIYDAAGEKDADPRHYIRTVKTLPK